MTQPTKTWTFPPSLLALTGFALAARLAAMGLFPLTDKTEARYGEIARKMAETNDWVTPQFDYGVPFWAKPPLSTWLSAASMDALGVNEFAARFPSFLLALAVLPLLHVFSRGMGEKPVRLAALAMLLTMGMFWVAMGTVMTDMTLVFSCVLTLVAFWQAVEVGDRKWGYSFFAAAGLGLLAKGPIALVLSGLPIFVYLCWTGNWRKMFSSLPWLGGLPLAALVGVPWYLLAEHKTPGFLQYFIVGEHFSRFMVPGWKGDLYGRAHEAPLGMIWPYLLADGLPWSLALLGVFGLRLAAKRPVLAGGLDAKTKYLLCWLLLPNLFFTFAHNIIATYPLVSLPALALLTARELGPLAVRDGRIKTWVYALCGVLPAAAVIGLFIIGFQPSLVPNTARAAGETFARVDAGAGDTLIYVGDRVYSMEFYTGGKTKHAATVAEALTEAHAMHAPYIALTRQQSADLNVAAAAQLTLAAEAGPRYLIYRVAGEGKAK
jgi:4-amino-4-deoxy-L-arabinose transferase-like glycosyltransferase